MMKRIVFIGIFNLILFILLIFPKGKVGATSYLPSQLPYTSVIITVDWWEGLKESNIKAAWYLFSRDYPYINGDQYFENLANNLKNNGFDLIAIAVAEEDLSLLENGLVAFTKVLQDFVNFAEDAGLEVFLTVEGIDQSGSMTKTTEQKESLLDATSSFNSNNEKSDNDLDGLITNQEFIRLSSETSQTTSVGWQPSGNNDAANQPAVMAPGAGTGGCSLFIPNQSYPPPALKQTSGYLIVLVPLFMVVLLFPLI